MIFNTLAFLVAAGQIAAAQDSIFSYSPRATTSDDNLATITALSDGHLPTCFTNHPTNPCPTDGPQGKRDLPEISPADINSAAHKIPIDPISMTASSGEHSLPTEVPAIVLRRDAPLKVNPNWIPDPSEWAIPQDFTFTDTISNSTGTASTTASVNSLSSKKQAHTASATKAHHSDSYLNNDKNYMRREDTYPARVISKARAESISTGLAESASTSCSDSQPAQSQINESPATAYLSAVSTTSSEPQATNTSSGHLSGMIGTLLSQQMFPGTMRAPTITSKSQSAIPTGKLAAVNQSARRSPSSASGSIVPIPMSQQPDPSATDASLQAFVHPIDTQAMANSQHTASTNDDLPTFAEPTPLAQDSVASGFEPAVTASASGSLQQAPAPSDEAEHISRELDLYLNSVVPAEPSQPVSMVTSEVQPTAAQAQPTDSPQLAKRAAHVQAHHHPMARRFIS